VYAPNSDNTVAPFQGGKHFLGFLLFFVLGPYYQKVENGDDSDKREESHQTARRA
jgi:hypothetical protein